MSATLTDVLDELDPARTQPHVRVGDIIDALDARGYGAALAILPLIEMSPLGGIPGIPTVLALTLALILGRFLLGYDHLWVPDWIRRKTLESQKVHTALTTLKPISAWIDKTFYQRLLFLVSTPAQTLAGGIMLMMLLVVPPLELIPFATTLPMFVICLFGLGFLYKDGLLMGLGFLGVIASLIAGVFFLF